MEVHAPTNLFIASELSSVGCRKGAENVPVNWKRGEKRSHEAGLDIERLPRTLCPSTSSQVWHSILT